MTRINPRVLAAALLFASPVWGAEPLATELIPGVTLRQAGAIAPPGEMALAAARSMGLAQGFRYVADTPGDWRSFALAHDSLLVWPRGTTLILTCEGHEVEAAELFAMTPPLEQRIIRLGGTFSVELDPGRLWRRGYRVGAVSTVFFARFPLDSCRGEATSLRACLARASTIGGR